MKCLSVCQPWATLLALGAKRYETRSWATSYRGPIAIHASKTFKEAARRLCEEDPFRTFLHRAGYRRTTDLPLGAVIGTAELIGCVATVDVRDADAHELRFGDFRPGRWAWALANAARLDQPVPFGGRLGVFEVPDDLLPVASVLQG